MKIRGILAAALLAAFLIPAAAMADDTAIWEPDYDYWYLDYDAWMPDYDEEDQGEAWEADSDDEYLDETLWAEEYDDGYLDDEYDWYAGYDDEDGNYDEEAEALNAYDGDYWYGDRLETWYSSEDAYHYMTPEWWVDDEGFYRTDEGYYVIAASDYEYGDVIEGSKGLCMVLDDGCDEGVSDYYVAW